MRTVIYTTSNPVDNDLQTFVQVICLFANNVLENSRFEWEIGFS